jgi:molybdenum cofactor cytidylyltransferase
MEKEIQYGIIVLAAGNSSRLGKSKQLLRYKDQSLLKHTVQQALSVPFSSTLVITGAEREEVELELENSEAFVVYNQDWNQGMSSSIRKGIEELQMLHPEAEGCIIAVCDQPFISSAIFTELIEKHRHTGFGIVASSYAGTAGTPVLLSKSYFAELLLLEGQEGAKKLLTRHETNLALAPFDKGEVDIDTTEDYDRLLATST